MIPESDLQRQADEVAAEMGVERVRLGVTETPMMGVHISLADDKLRITRWALGRYTIEELRYGIALSLAARCVGREVSARSKIHFAWIPLLPAVGLYIWWQGRGGGPLLAAFIISLLAAMWMMAILLIVPMRGASYEADRLALKATKDRKAARTYLEKLLAKRPDFLRRRLERLNDLQIS
jgi:hypothetical protein